MKKFSWILVLFLIPILAGGLGVATFAWWGLQPAQTNSEESKRITIAPGSSVTAIANKLEEEGLIRSAVIFKAIVWKEQLTGKIQAGSFTISPASSPREIANSLTQGTEDLWVTIREGLRATEIGEQLEQELDNFSTDDPEFEQECLTHEGYLFPETYLVPREYGTVTMCRYLREQFDIVMTSAWQAEIAAQGKTVEEIVTLASIIEREARAAADMKVVSGILWNRLEIGMPLQVDATLQYAKGYDPINQTWWAPPLAADKDVDSLYNTYQHPGLPPGPISNPGKNALEAAIFPTESDYLYYISNQEGSEMHYAVTYDEHLENIRLYLR